MSFSKGVGRSFQISVAMKEINCLPTLVLTFGALIKIMLSCISCVVAMYITSILKHVVEHFRQEAFMP